MAPTDQFLMAPCEPSDIPEMIEVHLRAFASNYLERFTFPPSIDPAERRRWLHHRILTSMSKAEIRMLKVIDTRTGKIAAWGRFGWPHKPSDEEQNNNNSIASTKNWPLGANLELCEFKSGEIGKIAKEIIVPEDTYSKHTLDIFHLLQVDTCYQRRGLGTMLLQHVIALADAEGKKCHIEASPEGHPLYLRLGFKDIHVIELDLTKWGRDKPGFTTIMQRNPRRN